MGLRLNCCSAGASLLVFVMFALCGSTAAAQEPGVISGVQALPPFFNPSIGQRTCLQFTVAAAGSVTAEILDRDRFVVRRLPAVKVAAGSVELTWDGKDDGGTTVPDEAYSWTVRFSGTGRRELYDPAAVGASQAIDVTSGTYSRSDGILAYTLPWPARVLIQAGQAKDEGAQPRAEGPVLKTIVDREPRAAGAVAELWNGFDEGSTTFVPALPRFVIGIRAERLPADAIIVTGTRGVRFVDYARARRAGATPRPARQDENGRDRRVRLSALEDRTPELLVSIRNNVAPHSTDQGRPSHAFEVEVAIDRLSAPSFLRANSELLVFADAGLIVKSPAVTSPAVLAIPAAALERRPERLVFNWLSGFGPVAVKSIALNGKAAMPPASPATN
jgi:hypothetical protein